MDSTNPNMEYVGKEEYSFFPICIPYLSQMVVLSNGVVPACCQDPHGENPMGDCRTTPLNEIWEYQSGKWHAGNIEASRQGRPWSSEFCNKCIGSGRLHIHQIRQYATKSEIHTFQNMRFAMPLSLYLETSALCNYRCLYCYSGNNVINRGKDSLLSVDMLETNIASHLSAIPKIKLFQYGEPFVHPQIIDIIRIVRDAAPQAELEFSTNGVMMTPEISEALVKYRVNRILLTLHGGHTQEQLARFATGNIEGPYEKTETMVRAMAYGPDIEVIKENIRCLQSIKRSNNSHLPWMLVKVLLASWNDSPEMMEDFLLWGRRLGVDFAGWEDILAEPRYQSKRVAFGSRAHSALRKRKLHTFDIANEFFPPWPAENFIPEVPVGGLSLDPAGWRDWFSGCEGEPAPASCPDPEC